MFRDEYITRLVNRLKEYNIKTLYEIMADYEQIIDEILIDNDDDFNVVIQKLGYPEILADEIVSEFGFKPINPKTKDNTKFNDNNRYDRKRQKSNVVWNLVISLYYIVQVGLSFVLLAIIGLLIYIGPNKSVSFKPIVDANQSYVEAKVCEKNRCDNYKWYIFFTNDNYDNDDIFDDNDFDEDDSWFMNCNRNGICQTPAIHTGLVGGFTISGIMFTQLVLYFLISRNVKSIISNNNEYNRRRNYE